MNSNKDLRTMEPVSKPLTARDWSAVESLLQLAYAVPFSNRQSVSISPTSHRIRSPPPRLRVGCNHSSTFGLWLGPKREGKRLFGDLKTVSQVASISVWKYLAHSGRAQSDESSVSMNGCSTQNQGSALSPNYRT